MKKFFAAVALVMFVSSSCLAMTFSQPQWVGSYSVPVTRPPCFIISGETYNSGEPRAFTYGNVTYEEFDVRGHKAKLYTQGVARFSNGDDALYLHYSRPNETNKVYYERLGGKDFSNTLDFNNLGYTTCDIFKIGGDSGYTFYLLGNYAPKINSSGINYYVIIGRKPDGSWIRFFDTMQIRKNYGGSGVFAYQIFTDKDTIITRYHVEKESYILGSKDYDPNERGEFLFKWDEAAQWFGVQHVKY